VVIVIALILGIIFTFVARYYTIKLWKKSQPNDAGWMVFWIILALAEYIISAAQLVRYGA